MTTRRLFGAARTTAWVVAWVLVGLAVLEVTPIVGLYATLALELLLFLVITHPWVMAPVAALVGAVAGLLCWSVGVDRRTRARAEEGRR